MRSGCWQVGPATGTVVFDDGDVAAIAVDNETARRIVAALNAEEKTGQGRGEKHRCEPCSFCNGTGEMFAHCESTPSSCPRGCKGAKTSAPGKVPGQTATGPKTEHAPPPDRRPSNLGSAMAEGGAGEVALPACGECGETSFHKRYCSVATGEVDRTAEAPETKERCEYDTQGCEATDPRHWCSGRDGAPGPQPVPSGSVRQPEQVGVSNDGDETQAAEARASALAAGWDRDKHLFLESTARVVDRLEAERQIAVNDAVLLRADVELLARELATVESCLKQATGDGPELSYAIRIGNLRAEIDHLSAEEDRLAKELASRTSDYRTWRERAESAERERDDQRGARERAETAYRRVVAERDSARASLAAAEERAFRAGWDDRQFAGRGNRTVDEGLAAFWAAQKKGPTG